MRQSQTDALDSLRVEQTQMKVYLPNAAPVGDLADKMFLGCHPNITGHAAKRGLVVDAHGRRSARSLNQKAARWIVLDASLPPLDHGGARRFKIGEGGRILQARHIGGERAERPPAPARSACKDPSAMPTSTSAAHAVFGPIQRPPHPRGIKMIHLSDTLLNLLVSSVRGIDSFLRTNTLRHPAEYRLGFRELGLSIGLHGVKKMQMFIEKHPECFTNHALLQSKLYELASYLPMCDIIEKFWIDPNNQKSSTWSEHLDINAVMLATSLNPECFLSI